MKTYYSKIDASTIIDSRDLALRKDELESLRDALEDAKRAKSELNNQSTDQEEQDADEAIWNAELAFGDDEREELAELETLENEVSEWRHGKALIREDHFTEYAEQLADDIGAIDPRACAWPLNHIDWEAAARELKSDYSESTYDGHTYFHRG